MTLLQLGGFRQCRPWCNGACHILSPRSLLWDTRKKTCMRGISATWNHIVFPVYSMYTWLCNTVYIVRTGHVILISYYGPLCMHTIYNSLKSMQCLLYWPLDSKALLHAALLSFCLRSRCIEPFYCWSPQLCRSMSLPEATRPENSMQRPAGGTGWTGETFSPSFMQRKYEKIKYIQIWYLNQRICCKAQIRQLSFENWLKTRSISETSGGTIHVAQKFIHIWFLNIVCDHDKMRSNQFSIWIAAWCLAGLLFQDLFERPIRSCLWCSWSRDCWNTPDCFFGHLEMYDVCISISTTYL